MVIEKYICVTESCIITSTDGDTMGIHYDYKSTRGAKKLQKQYVREQRRLAKKREQKKEPTSTVPEDVVLTLDMITDPNRNK